MPLWFAFVILLAMAPFRDAVTAGSDFIGTLIPSTDAAGSADVEFFTEPDSDDTMYVYMRKAVSDPLFQIAEKEQIHAMFNKAIMKNWWMSVSVALFNKLIDLRHNDNFAVRLVLATKNYACFYMILVDKQAPAIPWISRTIWNAFKKDYSDVKAKKKLMRALFHKWHVAGKKDFYMGILKKLLAPVGGEPEHHVVVSGTYADYVNAFEREEDAGEFVTRLDMNVLLEEHLKILAAALESERPRWQIAKAFCGYYGAGFVRFMKEMVGFEEDYKSLLREEVHHKTYNAQLEAKNTKTVVNYPYLTLPVVEEKIAKLRDAFSLAGFAKSDAIREMLADLNIKYKDGSHECVSRLQAAFTALLVDSIMVESYHIILVLLNDPRHYADIHANGNALLTLVANRSNAVIFSLLVSHPTTKFSFHKNLILKRAMQSEPHETEIIRTLVRDFHVRSVMSNQLIRKTDADKRIYKLVRHLEHFYYANRRDIYAKMPTKLLHERFQDTLYIVKTLMEQIRNPELQVDWDTRIKWLLTHLLMGALADGDEAAVAAYISRAGGILPLRANEWYLVRYAIYKGSVQFWRSLTISWTKNAFSMSLERFNILVVKSKDPELIMWIDNFGDKLYEHHVKDPLLRFFPGRMEIEEAREAIDLDVLRRTYYEKPQWDTIERLSNLYRVRTKFRIMLPEWHAHAKAVFSELFKHSIADVNFYVASMIAVDPESIADLGQDDNEAIFTALKYLQYDLLSLLVARNGKAGVNLLARDSKIVELSVSDDALNERTLKILTADAKIRKSYKDYFARIAAGFKDGIPPELSKKFDRVLELIKKAEKNKYC